MNATGRQMKMIPEGGQDSCAPNRRAMGESQDMQAKEPIADIM